MRKRPSVTIGPIEIERCVSDVFLALLLLIFAQIVVFTSAGVEALRYFIMLGA